jgi:2'-5' RNA ligase
VAASVADAGVREALARLRAALSAAPDLRWVRDEHLHLTLRFFADLPAERMDTAAEAAAAACRGAGPFALEIRGLGRFPSHGPLRVVWAGLGEGATALSALAEALARELEGRGFSRDERPFAPHLTLARARDPKGSRPAARLVASLAPTVGRLGVQRVDALVLYRSELGSGPPVHTPVRRVPLAE